MRIFCRILFTIVVVACTSAPVFASRFIITGADAGGGPHVIVRYDADNNGTFETISDSFYAFAPASPQAPLFAGGVRVATGDFDGDGNDELVTAMGPGGSTVRIWSLTSGGMVSGLVEEFSPYGGFTGGVFVATGDFDGDGRDELVTAPDAGGGPHIIVWRDSDRDGRLTDNPPMSQFFAYTTGFSGGVRIAAGNVNNTGGDDLITAPGPGGGPHIRVLTWNGASFVSIDEFFAYTPGFTGGVYVAAGPIENAGTAGAEIITSPGAGGGPHVRIFTDTDADGIVSDNPPFEEFFAYAPGFSGGVRVAVGDTDNSGTFVEVITAPGPGGGPHIRVVDDNGDSGSLITDNPVDDEFFAYDPAWSGGVFVAAGRFGGTAAAFGGQPIVIVDASTTTLFVCVPAGAGNIRDLDVGLGITHTFNVDLDVTLTHLASGVSVQLFTDVGNNDDGFMVRLNDEAATDIGTVVDDANDKPVAGSFNPEGTALLSAFDGLSASGCWALTVTDDVGSDFGTLFDWILFFTF
jgi:subtilisin-like proprotein convertase family protein